MVRAAGRGREIQWRAPTPRTLRKPLKIPFEMPLEMITRAEWAANPRVELDSDIRLTLPIRHIRYTFTDTDECANQEECIPFLQNLQKDHQEKGYPDLMYNFLIGSDGLLYEGRGLDWKCTVFADPWVNSVGESINVAYIGRFHNVRAPWRFRHTSKLFQKWMLRHILLHEEFELTPSICWPDDYEDPDLSAKLAEAKSDPNFSPVKNALDPNLPHNELFQDPSLVKDNFAVNIDDIVVEEGGEGEEIELN